MTGGNSARAQASVTSLFVPWWKVWAWCWARTPSRAAGGDAMLGSRCRLPRGHRPPRHCTYSPNGFDLVYFDTPKDGTP